MFMRRIHEVVAEGLLILNLRWALRIELNPDDF